MCSVVDKIDLLSEATAANMVALHMLAHPACSTISAYPCGDHFHIGHSTLTSAERAATAVCKSEPFHYPDRAGKRRR